MSYEHSDSHHAAGHRTAKGRVTALSYAEMGFGIAAIAHIEQVLAHSLGMHGTSFQVSLHNAANDHTGHGPVSIGCPDRVERILVPIVPQTITVIGESPLINVEKYLRAICGLNTQYYLVDYLNNNWKYGTSVRTIRSRFQFNLGGVVDWFKPAWQTQPLVCTGSDQCLGNGTKSIVGERRAASDKDAIKPLFLSKKIEGLKVECQDVEITFLIVGVKGAQCKLYGTYFWYTLGTASWGEFQYFIKYWWLNEGSDPEFERHFRKLVEEMVRHFEAELIQIQNRLDTYDAAELVAALRPKPVQTRFSCTNFPQRGLAGRRVNLEN